MPSTSSEAIRCSGPRRLPLSMSAWLASWYRGPSISPNPPGSQHTPHLADRTPLLVLFEQLVEGRPETDDGVERLRSIRQARHRTDGQADAELFGIGRPTRRLDQVLE